LVPFFDSFIVAVWLGLTGALAAPGTESRPAEPPEEVLAEAKALWQAGDDAAVARLFERAYASDPRPEYLYGWARAEAALGHCDRAVSLLRRFLATEPLPAQVKAAERDIEACGESIVAPPYASASDETQPQPVEPTVPAPMPAQATPEHSLVHRMDDYRPISLRQDRVALGLVVSGVTVSVGGLAMLAAGLVLQRRPAGTATEDDFVQKIRGGRTLAATGVLLGSVGTGLIVAGIAELVIRRRKARSASVGRTISVVARPRGIASSR
jgi:hypothetical protein